MLAVPFRVPALSSLHGQKGPLRGFPEELSPCWPAALQDEELTERVTLLAHAVGLVPNLEKSGWGLPGEYTFVARTLWEEPVLFALVPREPMPGDRIAVERIVPAWLSEAYRSGASGGLLTAICPRRGEAGHTVYVTWGHPYHLTFAWPARDSGATQRIIADIEKEVSPLGFCRSACRTPEPGGLTILTLVQRIQ